MIISEVLPVCKSVAETVWEPLLQQEAREAELHAVRTPQSERPKQTWKQNNRQKHKKGKQ